MEIDAPDAALVLRRIGGVAGRAELIRVTSRQAVDAAVAMGVVDTWVADGRHRWTHRHRSINRKGLIAMIRNIALAVAALAVTAGTASAADAPQAGPTDLRWQIKPCQVEDDWNCFWNAGEQGDGHGHSFWAIPVGQSRVAIVYWNARYNRRHGFITGH